MRGREREGDYLGRVLLAVYSVCIYWPIDSRDNRNRVDWSSFSIRQQWGIYGRECDGEAIVELSFWGEGGGTGGIGGRTSF